VQFLPDQGVPVLFTCDRDPPFVGSSSSDDFPSAFCRFLRLAGHSAHYLSTPSTRQQSLCRARSLERLGPNVCRCIDPARWKRCEPEPSALRSMTTRSALIKVELVTTCPHGSPSPISPTCLRFLPRSRLAAGWSADRRQAFVRREGLEGCVQVNHDTSSISRDHARAAGLLVSGEPWPRSPPWASCLCGANASTTA
jgi:hypothetical protein